MTKTELLEILGKHKESKARRAILEADVQDMLISLNRAAMTDAAESTIRGAGFDGAPSSGRIGKPVESAALRSIEGKASEALERWKAECEAMQEELAKLVKLTDRVDKAMEALTQMERQIIELHEMERVSWRELGDRSRSLWGYFTSEGTLRNRQRKAVEKMLAAMK